MAEAGAAVSENTEALSPKSSLFPQMSLAKAMLISARPKQWAKNGLLLLGLVFSRSLSHPDLVMKASLAMVDFCLLASATYLINDLMDVEKDRLHPVKRGRPIASGRMTPFTAAAMSIVLLVVSLALAVALGGPYAFSAGIYLLLTLSYSVWLKHVVILDVLVVAAGFVIRAAAGAVVIGVPISPWLYVCTMLGALFLVFCKRRHELVLLEASAASHRRILGEYSIQLLDQMISVVTSATVIAYSLYTFSAENLPKNSAMMLTIPFLLYGIFRYLYLIHVKGVGGSPEELLFTDRPLLATVFGWGVVSTLILYLVR